MTHICINKLTIIGSDNGLSPDRRQAIIWTNAGILLIGPLGTNFSEIFIGIHKFSFKKMHLKMSSGKWRPFCLGLNVLSQTPYLQFDGDVSVKEDANCTFAAKWCLIWKFTGWTLINPYHAKFILVKIQVYLHGSQQANIFGFIKT